jgi:hypothetical protein
VVAKIFSEQFFATVWRLEARLDRYLRNGRSPQPTTSILTRRVARRKQISVAQPGTLAPNRKVGFGCNCFKICRRAARTSVPAKSNIFLRPSDRQPVSTAGPENPYCRAIATRRASSGETR